MTDPSQAGVGQRGGGRGCLKEYGFRISTLWREESRADFDGYARSSAYFDLGAQANYSVALPQRGR
jgi:hypothetical protein